MGAPLRTNANRLQADFEALAAIGATVDGGVHRPALSEAHLQARAWLQERIVACGLRLHQDGAGNLSAFLACGPENARTLLMGSHLDSVPYGGRFDGPLGVLAGLEALRTVQEAELQLPFHLEVIDFTDEEGTLVGLLGSQALAGSLKPQDLLTPRGGRQALIDGLVRAGLSEMGILQSRRDANTLAGYLELHIEQGPRLYQSGTQIGVVTAIVGIASFRLIFRGKAIHAGTTPMEARQDAGAGANAFAVKARQIVMEAYPGCVMNIGDMQFEPGAFNIVPGQVTLSLELRAAENEVFHQLEEAILTCARTEAQKASLELAIEALGRHEPTAMHHTVQQAIQTAAETMGLSHTDLASGAGHDAYSLAGVCPSGMIFIPSVEGISHSPRELSRWEDCVNGADVLLGAILTLAEQANQKGADAD